MKVALVYDDLYQRGGGETFFKHLISLYPDATIYSPIVGREFSTFKHNIVKSGFLSSVANLPGIFGYKLASLLSLVWFENLDFFDFDLVITLSNRFSHCIVTTPQTKHINIVTSPFREFWEDPVGFSPEIFSLNSLVKGFFRTHSFYSARRADVTVCISKHVVEKVKKCWRLPNKDLHVLYPPVLLATKNTNRERDSFVLMAGRVNKWKYPYFVSALQEILKQNIPVKFVGTGPLLNKLKTSFKDDDNISFLGYVSQKDLEALYSTCKILVHPQVEDFGLIPLEALRFNTPICYFNQGGVPEYLNDKVSTSYNLVEHLSKNMKYAFEKDFSKASSKEIIEIHYLGNFRYNLTKIIKSLE